MTTSFFFLLREHGTISTGGSICTQAARSVVLAPPPESVTQGSAPLHDACLASSPRRSCLKTAVLLSVKHPTIPPGSSPPLVASSLAGRLPPAHGVHGSAHATCALGPVLSRMARGGWPEGSAVWARGCSVQAGDLAALPAGPGIED